MNIFTLISLSVFILLPKLGYSSTNSNLEYYGTLRVANMVQGTLLWLDGRVGQGIYTYKGDDDQTCTLRVPVAVGNLAGSGVSIREIKGMSIIVRSQRLSEALIQGERITNSDDYWRFSFHDSHGFDGVLESGINTQEHFILNSRKRWVAWLAGEKQHLPICV